MSDTVNGAVPEDKILITKTFPETTFPPDIGRWLRSRAKRGYMTDPKDKFCQAYLWSCACQLVAPQFGLGSNIIMILTRDVVPSPFADSRKFGFWHLLIGVKTLRGYATNPNEVEFWKQKIFGRFAPKALPINVGGEPTKGLIHIGLPVANWNNFSDPVSSLTDA